MSSITAGTYPESVSSCCHAPTRPPSPPPHLAPAIHGAPLRQRFDFPEASSGGDPEEEDEDFIRVVEYIERARQCACGRGRCAVEERDEQRGRWVYVCPAQPKCNYVSVCEEVGLDPELQPAVRSPPKPRNNCVINISSNHVAEPRTPINNVNLQGAGATTPNIVSPQATIPKTPLNSTFQSAGTSIPLHVNPKGPSTTAAVKIKPQGAGSNLKWCKCGAGKCIKLRKGSEDYYVCPIPKGHGACSYMVPVVAAVNEPTQTGTRGDKHLKDNLVERKDNGNLDQTQDNDANGSVNPPQPEEKEVHGNNLVQAQDNDVNGSVNSQSDDEEVVDNEIVRTAQTMTSAEVCQASPTPSMKCERTEYGKQDNDVNGSVNSQSDDEEVVDNEIVRTAQTTTTAEVRQESPTPSMKCETTGCGQKVLEMVKGINIEFGMKKEAEEDDVPKPRKKRKRDTAEEEAEPIPPPMVEAPTESPVALYDTSSPINPHPENRVPPTGRILQAFGELMISCCSGLCPP